MPEQVITLVAAKNKIFSNLDRRRVKEFQKELIQSIRMSHKDIIDELEETKVLSDAAEDRIVKAAGKLKADSKWHS